MATVRWRGQADAVAQVTTVTVGGTLSGETFTISVGGVAIASHTDSTTDPDDAKTALVSAWNASTHVYATGVTASPGGTGEVVLTADTAGVPFTVTLNTPGGSATLGQAATTANAGPNDWSADDNWIDETGATGIPANSDIVVIENSSVPINWGLDQSSVTPTRIDIYDTFTGTIGLPRHTFQTGAATSVSTKPEYRETYLKIGAATVNFYAANGTTAGVGSGRVKINVGSTNTTFNVYSTATAATESAKQPVRLLGSAITAVNVYKGTVGVATDSPGETATVTTLNQSYISSQSADSNVTLGDGVTTTTINKSGGVLAMGSGCSTLNHLGGTLTKRGPGTITTFNHKAGTTSVAGSGVINELTITGGTCYLNTSGTVSSLYVSGGGVLDMNTGAAARTVSNLDINGACTVRIDPAIVTLTNDVDLQSSKAIQIVASAA